ncbi:MAG: DEAD/DEAH box helicase [Methanophagales archaeon]|nr:DEAD/DEAH box helicase [Methanophagales archaeon]
MEVGKESKEIATRILGNKNFLEDTKAVKELYRKVRLELEGLGHETPLSNRLLSTAYLLEHEGITQLEKDFTSEEAIKFFSKAAEIFEYVFTGLKGLPDETKFRIILHSSFCYTLAGYSPNSQVLAEEIWRNVYDKWIDIEKSEDFFYSINQLILLLLRRKIDWLKKQASNIDSQLGRVEDLIAKEMQEGKIGIDQIGLFTGHVYLVKSLGPLSEFLTTGDEGHLKQIEKDIDAALEIFSDIYSPETYLKTKLLKYSIKKIIDNSVWRQLHSFKLIPKRREYLTSLINSENPIFELWKSQIDAIKGGILDEAKNRLVISMPTSAGKTKIAEISIIQTLSMGADLTCIYVVPTRALVTQIEHELNISLGSLGYRVSSIVGTIEMTEAESYVLKYCDVLVTTPEKLDLLLRRKEEVVERCGLVIFDEGHNIEEVDIRQAESRGLKLELTIVKVKLDLPNAKILLLSAVLPNSHELADWLSNGKGTAITLDWRPTRLEAGYFYWDDLKGIVKYTDGCSFKVFTKRIKTDPDFKTTRKVTAKLSEIFRKWGTVLVLTTSKSRTEDIAEELRSELTQLQLTQWPKKNVTRGAEGREINKLRTMIRREVAPDFLLEKLLRFGVAYHHADLPPRIRLELERTIKAGFVDYVIATTTLAEGVNLPISTVIVERMYYPPSRDAGKQKPIPEREFWNIAGRAGRALEDTEGQVIIIKPDKWNVQKIEDYLASRDKLPEVKSALKRLFEVVVSSIVRKFEINLEEISFDNEAYLFVDYPLIEEFQLSLLHGLLERRFDNETIDEIRSFVDQTLFAHQVKKDELKYRKFVEFTSAHVRYIRSCNLINEDFKKLVNRTGLSINSCLQLFEKIKSVPPDELEELVNIRQDEDASDKLPEIDFAKIKQIADLIFDIRELKSSKKDINTSEVLCRWIRGDTLLNIANEFFAIKKEKKNKRKLEDCSNYIYSKLTNFAPWGLYAFSEMFEYLRKTENLSENKELRFLSLYATYGVNEPVSAFLCLLGVERLDSITLSKKYRETVSVDLFSSWDDINEWFSGLTEERLKNWFSEAEREFDSYLVDLIEEIRKKMKR